MRNHGLFQPDVLIAELAGAARRRSAALSSEKRLMLAVMQDAFDCYQKYMFASDRVGRELFEEAAAWIACTNTDGLFSFESISEALDIEPQYLRRGLAEWHQRHINAQASRVGSPVASVAVASVTGAPRLGVADPSLHAASAVPLRSAVRGTSQI